MVGVAHWSRARLEAWGLGLELWGSSGGLGGGGDKLGHGGGEVRFARKARGEERGGALPGIGEACDTYHDRRRREARGPAC